MLYYADNCDVTGNDPWFKVRSFVEEFNKIREKVLHVGQHIVVDELMSSWLGVPSQFNVDGIPHQTKIARKPKGVGAEAAQGF